MFGGVEMRWEKKRKFWSDSLFKVRYLHDILGEKVENNLNTGSFYNKMGFIEFLPPFILLQEFIERGDI